MTFETPCNWPGRIGLHSFVILALPRQHSLPPFVHIWFLMVKKLCRRPGISDVHWVVEAEQLAASRAHLVHDGEEALQEARYEWFDALQVLILTLLNELTQRAHSIDLHLQQHGSCARNPNPTQVQVGR